MADSPNSACIFSSETRSRTTAAFIAAVVFAGALLATVLYSTGWLLTTIAAAFFANAVILLLVPMRWAIEIIDGEVRWRTPLTRFSTTIASIQEIVVTTHTSPPASVHLLTTDGTHGVPELCLNGFSRVAAFVKAMRSLNPAVIVTSDSPHLFPLNGEK